MLATCCQSVIFVWDYESLKLISSMFNEKVDILTIEFLDPYQSLISLDNKGVITIWEELLQKSLSF